MRTGVSNVSVPPAIPVTPSTMNYCIVVFVGFMTISAAWYGIHARHGKLVLVPVIWKAF